MLEEIIQFNEQFVREGKYQQYIAGKYPEKKVAILTCMDTRLTELLPAALGIKNGDVKIIKNAGAVISHPFGSVVRSLLIAIYNLGVKEIAVIGHTDCGVQSMESADMISRMKERGISEQALELMRYCGINFEEWLSGFDDAEIAIRESVTILREHPLIPKDIIVKGFMMDSTTGMLSLVD